jgi:hypothetical protein
MSRRMYRTLGVCDFSRSSRIGPTVVGLLQVRLPVPFKAEDALACPWCHAGPPVLRVSWGRDSGSPDSLPSAGTIRDCAQ